MLLQICADLNNVPRAVRGNRGDLPVAMAMEGELNYVFSHFES